MTKIFSYEAGKTLDSHKKFLKKLTKRGAKIVDFPEKSDVVIIFCPIVSRYETDINSALSGAQELRQSRDLILVTMHHTFNEDYIVPNHRNSTVALHVDCLFFEKRGLYKCPQNKMAIKMVRKKLGLKKIHQVTSWMK